MLFSKLKVCNSLSIKLEITLIRLKKPPNIAKNEKIAVL